MFVFIWSLYTPLSIPSIELVISSTPISLFTRKLGFFAYSISTGQLFFCIISMNTNASLNLMDLTSNRLYSVLLLFVMDEVARYPGLFHWLVAAVAPS